MTTNRANVTEPYFTMLALMLLTRPLLLQLQNDLAMQLLFLHKVVKVWYLSEVMLSENKLFRMSKTHLSAILKLRGVFSMVCKEWLSYVIVRNSEWQVKLNIDLTGLGFLENGLNHDHVLTIILNGNTLLPATEKC